MKPKTMIEKEVAQLSVKLSNLSKQDTARLIKNTYGKYAYDEMYNRCYAVVNQAYKGWQVLRYFRIDRTRNRKKEVNYTLWEVFQFWNKVGCKQVLMARQRAMSYYVDAFNYSSKLEIRENPIYSRSYIHFSQVGYTYIYDKSLTGAYKYIDKLVDKSQCYRWYRFIASDKFAETILKFRPEIARYMMEENLTDKYYFTAMRIAIRHNYEIEHICIYFDMIKAMHQLGCDLNNPHFVCPEDIQHTHDWATAATGQRRTAEDTLRKVKNKKNENANYIKYHSQYFGLEITDGTITCNVLQSIQDFYEEGKAMHHCVYANAYYEKKNSLIFSARIDGKRVETVEYDINQGKVIQAYGVCDKFTIHHQRIVDLVNNNKQLIDNCNNNRIAI